jgi:hypothetical protein
MRIGRIISAALLTLVALLATAKLSCTVNIGLPPQPAPQAAPADDAANAPPLLGLPADFKEKAADAYKAFPAPFRIQGEAGENRKKQALLFRAELAVETARKPKGQFYPSEMQQTSDCVSWGWARAIFVTSANQVVHGKAAKLIDPFQPFAYGGSRVTIGGGRPRCNQGGAYPDDAAQLFKEYGYVSYAEAGEKYSGQLADQWGCKGPPQALLQTGKARAGGDVYPARTTDEAIDALCNGYALTGGIEWRPGRTKPLDGFTITQFDGRNLGGHQVALIGYDGLAGDGQFVFGNSHGPDAHPQNPGDPPGSFRVTRATLDWMMETGTFWVFSSVPGFPANELDLSGLDDLVMRSADAPAVAQREKHYYGVSKRLLAP